VSDRPRELLVYMDGLLAGVLGQSSSGRLSFAYDEAYLGDDPTPISRSIPLDVVRHKPAHVTNFFAGLLPDNERTLAAMARRYGVSPGNPFGILARVGRDTAGALQIVSPGEDVPDATDRVGDIEWLTEPELQAEVANLRRPGGGEVVAAKAGRWSLAGAQNKIALHRDGERWGVPRDSTPTTHIVKTTIDGFPDHDLNEYASMRVAAARGLPAARTTIVRFGQERALVSERYDRLQGAKARWRRIHQEDLCQALGVHPSRKYQDQGGPSVRQIAGVLNEIDSTSSSAFFDYLNYNVAIGATDAHAKNFSLIMIGANSRLAPLYDVASYLPYRTAPTRSAGLFEESPSSAMRIGRNQDLDRIGERDFVEVAKILRVQEDDAIERFRAMRADCADAFLHVADSFDGSTEERAFLTQLAGQVASQCQRQLKPTKR